MKNPRLKGIVNQFGDKYQLEDSLPERFQMFANYLLLKKEYYEINQEYPFESLLDIDLLDAINFGHNNSMAIDGCFIIHNKSILHLGMDNEDLEEALSLVDKGDIHIIIIQTKSGDINTTDLSTLSDCLNANFQDQTEWVKFLNFRQQCDSLLQRTTNKVKIKFKTIYVSGNRIDENLLNNTTFTVRENALKNAMRSYFWINDNQDVSIDYFDEEKFYTEYQNQLESSKIVSSTLSFIAITDEISCGVSGKVRFGAVSLGEMMKVLFDTNSQKPNELYRYNVRDLVEDSKINERIEDSIQNNSEIFLLLNNGITLVVDNQERRGDKGIYLENIRIVNGCQTSHSILKVCNSCSSFNNTNVPVKIIQTDNESILGKITYSSNSQNHVSKANLFAIEPKIFDLESAYKDFFLTYTGNSLMQVELERRQGQFNNSSVAYIDMLVQAKAYIALWNKKPHTAVMYVEQNLNTYKSYIDNNLFINKSLFAGILWYNINTKISTSYVNARFHIFSSIALKLLEKILNIENSYSQNIFEEIDNNNVDILAGLNSQRISLTDEIRKVCNAIDSLPEYFPKLSSGKIHYRKFYPESTLELIYNKYKELNATN